MFNAKGKESFYKQFGFTERPNETVGSGMTQYIRKANDIITEVKAIVNT